jgi:hypothetical protein
MAKLHKLWDESSSGAVTGATIVDLTRSYGETSNTVPQPTKLQPVPLPPY